MKINHGEICFSERGGVSSFKYGDRELIKKELPLAEIRLRYKSGETLDISTAEAGRVSVFEEKIVFSEFPVDIKLSVRVEYDSGVSFFSEVENSTEALVEWVMMPILGLSSLKGDGGEGELLWPYNEGIVIKSLEARERSWFPHMIPEYPSLGCYGIFPNMISSQFEAIVYDGFGIYVGVHDKWRGVKGIDLFKREDATTPEIRIFTAGEYGCGVRTEFPVRIELFEGNWQDGAEIYRRWFEENLPHGARKISENPNIPAWYADMPLVVTYPVRGLFDTDVMEPNALYPYKNALPLLDRISERVGSKIMVALMHWEGTAPWAPPYVWPPYGGEEELSDFADELHKRGGTLGVYCSGFGYTERSNLIPEYNNLASLEEGEVFGAFCKGPGDEIRKSKICTSQRSGYDICVKPEISKRILNEAYEPLFRANVDYVQMLDQNHGGGQYFCYASDHGHPPAPGRWMTDEMVSLLDGWQRSAPGKTFGCESAAAEAFIGKLLFSDNRYFINWHASGMPVPLYSYLYHEYLHNFMGNQVCLGLRFCKDSYRVRMAYSFVAGDCLTFIIRPDGKILPAWGHVGDEELPSTELALEFAKNLVSLYKTEAGEFLYDGRVTKTPELTCEKEIFQGYGEGEEYEIPAVYVASYEKGGRVCTVLANHTEKDQAVTVGERSVIVPKISATYFID